MSSKRLTPLASLLVIPPLARWLGMQRIDLEACASTNDEAARMARAGAKHGTVIIAEQQSAGRGRDGRPWASPRGRGLYLSCVLRPPLPLSDVPPMTLAIGVGLCDAVRAAGVAGSLKWPNDILVGTRKLAGVLVEAQSQGSRLEAVIAGIGINLSPPEPGELPPEIAARAVSLEEAAGSVIDREAFIETLFAHVEHWVDHYTAVGLEEVIPAWIDRMAHGLGARAIVDGVSVVGMMVGLDGDGALLLRDADGLVHRVRSGDVEAITAPPPAMAEPRLASC
jgi:BirA family transcriptional regulator, biotin operon repressor / biotin---[acetyl-CoA-carboxylase] ligase